jgi:hypothetical protein
MLLLPPAVYLAQLAVDSGGDAGGVHHEFDPTIINSIQLF